MEADSSQGIRDAAPYSIRELVVFFMRYVELRLQLLGLGSPEAAFHLLMLALLVVSAVARFGCFLIMLVVFLLYVMMLMMHWEWGWRGLALAAVLLVLSIGAAIIFRFRIANPFLRATCADLQRDREWLKHTAKSSK
jgi:uncharacterized membrane protein YqjE